MANIIDENGIQILTLQEILDEKIANYKAIYGADINVEQNTADGQRINIEAQALIDLLEFIVSVYNSFNPDLAVGRNLDERCAINNIQRQSAEYTYTNISVVVSKALNLVGLDDVEEDTPADKIASDVFTISDDAGNEFVLVSSQSPVGAGTYSYSFRAKKIGQVLTTLNTINVLVSIIDGVVSVNNSASATITGIDEETDTELRLRRPNSVAIGASGFKESLTAKLLALDGMLDVRILQNRTATTDGDGIPAYSIWVICQSKVNNNEIANIIYAERFGGGMKGDTSVIITEIDGEEMTIKFDYATNEDLYIDFEIQKLFGSSTIDFDYIKTELVKRVKYKIGQTANKSEIEKEVLNIIDNVYVKNLRVSNDGINWVDTLATTNKDNVFILDIARISIDYV